MDTNFVQRYVSPKRTAYRPIRPYFNPSEFSIEKLDFAEAKEYVCSWHYSGSISAARRTFGLYQHNELVGAAVYSVPMNNLTITNTLKCSNPNDGLELSRLVLRESCESNSESFFISECNRRLKREGFAGVVTFADDVARLDADGKTCFRGHIGTLYAACNSAYTGRGTPRVLRILPDGTTFSDRTAQKIRAGEIGWQYGSRILESFGATDCPEDAEQRREWLKYWLKALTRPLRHPGNLKFAWSFARLKIPSLPYPKIRFSEMQMALNF